MAVNLEHKDWQGTTDGTKWMLETLIRLFKMLPLRVLYILMATWIPFYVIFGVRGTAASYSFARKRLGRSVISSVLYVFANEYKFGQIILDRFAMYAGKKFDIKAKDIAVFRELSQGEKGFMMLGSHTGNYELAGYTFPERNKTIYAVIFSGEKETVMKGRESRFSHTNIKMVPMKEDLSHIFELNAQLAEGNIVSMPGDRVFGSTKSLTSTFFGSTAHFPAGPFALCVGRNLPAVMIFVMKTGLRTYETYIERIDPPTEGTKAEKMQKMADTYARGLEEAVRKHPLQWFNFYDFWKK